MREGGGDERHPSAAASVTRYRAFISYSHADSAWGAWLHKALETYRVPSRLVGARTAAGVIPRRLAPIFRDRDELASAADLGARVNDALARSDNLIVICSPRSAASRWVNEEVLAFKRLGRDARIFCLIVGGEPNASDLPGRAAEECFCPALRFKLDANGRPTGERTEPIAADARPSGDGKAGARLKLIAGLLDVGFDALRQRELQRRNRRMAAVTAMALIATAVTTTLAITAVFARHAAVVAQAAAERRQKQAEDLVGFMLGDLNDKLAQVSRLDIMEAVDDQAMAYFRSLPTADVTDQALAQRVTALQEIGAVREQQGKLARALESYQAALALAAERLRRAPKDVLRQAQYASSLTWIGRVYWFQGDLPQAAQNFRAASDLLRKAAEARPADTRLAYQLSSALVNTGRVLEARGDFSTAKPYYVAARDNYVRLRAREPANAQWPLQLAYAYNSLGKLALQQGQLGQAIAGYRADQHLKATLAAQDPNNRQVQEGLLISNAILGRTLGLCGEMEAAVHFTGLAVAGAQKLMAFDATNKYWQDDFALYSLQMGGLLRQQGQLDQAAAADDNAAHLVSSLAAVDPANTLWQQDLAQSRLEQSRLQLARDDVGAAASAATDAQAAVERLRRKNVDDRGLILLAAQADLVLGQIAARRKDGAAASHYWTQARDTILPATRSGADPNFLAAYAEALLRLDQTEAARPVVARLNAMGYRTPDFVALVTGRHLAYPVNVAFSRRIAQMLPVDAVSPPPPPDAVRPSPSAQRRDGAG
ncbi:MAG: toll/interleukin-1 receptor domain-containing protein [Gammaproteobacteria bacterium]|nr:toll/interleukin-1 receptor domain-containing protein [Gammaproteobacteria bacterium]